MPGLLLSVVRHQILISQLMIDHLSYHLSHLSSLRPAGCDVGVDGESRDLRLSSTTVSRPGPARAPADVT